MSLDGRTERGREMKGKMKRSKSSFNTGVQNGF